MPGRANSRAAAEALGRAFLPHSVDGRTEPRDLLYTVDTVARLAEAQLMSALRDVEPREVRRRIDVLEFVQPGPLWWAFDWDSAREQARRSGAGEPVTPEGWVPEHGSVVLVDEIDKADSDVPNGLLEALGHGRFDVPGRAAVTLDRTRPPLVVITTNEERALPDAFLRRCLVLHLTLPEEAGALVRTLVERGRAHFNECGGGVLEAGRAAPRQGPRRAPPAGSRAARARRVHRPGAGGDRAADGRGRADRAARAHRRLRAAQAPPGTWAVRTAVGRADLLRIVAGLPAERVARAAALLGFEAPAQAAREEVVPAPLEAARVQSLAHEPAGAPAPTEPMPFWRLEEMTFADPPEPTPAGVTQERSGGLTEDDLRSPGCSLFATPPAPPLTPWPRLWPTLREALQASIPGRDPDVPAFVQAWVRGEVVRRVPRVPQRGWAGRASVWVDRSARLVPFWSDQADICRRLRKVCGQSGLDVRLLDGAAQARAMVRRGDFRAGFRGSPTTPVLVLGDLGGHGSEVERAAWRRTALRLRAGGVRVTALVPSPEARWDPAGALPYGVA